jgi:hypothetical protein
MWQRHWKVLIWFLVFNGNSFLASAQELVIESGRKNIALNEPFAITLVIRNTQAQNTYSPFPEIAGMQKREVTTMNLKEEINNKNSISQRITQYYFAAKKGVYVLPSFTMTVNGKVVASPGFTVTVEDSGSPAAGDTLAKRLYDEILSMEKEVTEKKENAFLALSTDRDTVFVGEGFTLTLALYVAENNEVEMKSFGEGAQMLRILRDLKPANSWEQDFNIREFRTAQVPVNGKRYAQYKMYQATFYPYNADTIRLPGVSFRMLKLQAGPSPKAAPRTDTVTFLSQPRTVYVKPLPPHPMRDGMPVGNFRLEEAVSKGRLQTGQPFTYQLTLSGDGNLSAANLTAAGNGEVLEFYPPEISSQVNTQSSRPVGRKVFRFAGLVREPGRFPLDSVFSFVYFNPTKGQYDTLRPRTVLQVTGQTLENTPLAAGEPEIVYQNIDSENNRLRPLKANYSMRQIANVLLLVMMLVTMILIGYKK